LIETIWPCPSVHISIKISQNVEIQHTDSKNIDAAQVCDPCCHANSNAHTPHKTVKPTLLKNVLIFFHIFFSLVNFYRFTKKKFLTPLNRQKLPRPHFWTNFWIFFNNLISLVNLYRYAKKLFATPNLTP